MDVALPQASATPIMQLAAHLPSVRQSFRVHSDVTSIERHISYIFPSASSRFWSCPYCGYFFVPLIGLSYRLHVPEYLFVDDITPRQQFLRFGKVNRILRTCRWCIYNICESRLQPCSPSKTSTSFTLLPTTHSIDNQQSENMAVESKFDPKDMIL